MKILIVSWLIYPFYIGGAEIHAYNQATQLVKSGHHVLVFTGDPESKIPRQRMGSRGFTVYVIKTLPPPLSGITFFLGGVIRYRALKISAQVVHVHFASIQSMLIACLVRLIANTPYVVSCHGSDIRQKKSGFARLLQKVLLLNASHITSVSKEMEGILIERYGVPKKRVTTIPNCYDEITVEKFKKMSEQISEYLVFVGSLRTEKDPLTLLKSVKKVMDKEKDVVLYVIGDGPLRYHLEKFCRKNSLTNTVLFLGFLPHETVLRLVAKSKIFVMSSVEEGLPTALIEAMAIGKPVVTTAVGGITEVVKDGINGIIIPPKSPELLAKALERLLNDSDLRRKLGRVAAESVKDHALSKTTEKYEAIYHEVLRLEG